MGGMRTLRRGPIPAHQLVSRSHELLWERACRGLEPAEALDHRDREDLVAQLLLAGWSVSEIAGHTRMTEYTTTRIAARFQAQSSGVAA